MFTLVCSKTRAICNICLNVSGKSQDLESSQAGDFPYDVLTLSGVVGFL